MQTMRLCAMFSRTIGELFDHPKMSVPDTTRLYTTGWDSQDRTRILTIFHQPLTWPTVLCAHDEIFALMESVPHRVDWINDISASPEIPKEHIFQNLRLLRARVPANAGANIVVNRSLGTFSRTVLRIFVNASGWMHGFAIVGSVEEARVVAARLRSGVTTHEAS